MSQLSLGYDVREIKRWKIFSFQAAGDPENIGPDGYKPIFANAIARTGRTGCGPSAIEPNLTAPARTGAPEQVETDSNILFYWTRGKQYDKQASH